MNLNEKLLIDSIKLTLATYIETRRRTRDDVRNAIAELKNYLPNLIKAGHHDRTQLAVKALTRLRELEDRPLAVPAWMRRRAEIRELGSGRTQD